MAKCDHLGKMERKTMWFFFLGIPKCLAAMKAPFRFESICSRKTELLACSIKPSRDPNLFLSAGTECRSRRLEFNLFPRSGLPPTVFLSRGRYSCAQSEPDLSVCWERRFCFFEHFFFFFSLIFSFIYRGGRKTRRQSKHAQFERSDVVFLPPLSSFCLFDKQREPPNCIRFMYMFVKFCGQKLNAKKDCCSFCFREDTLSWLEYSQRTGRKCTSHYYKIINIYLDIFFCCCFFGHWGAEVSFCSYLLIYLFIYAFLYYLILCLYRCVSSLLFIYV